MKCYLRIHLGKVPFCVVKKKNPNQTINTATPKKHPANYIREVQIAALLAQTHAGAYLETLEASSKIVPFLMSDEGWVLNGEETQ